MKNIIITGGELFNKGAQAMTFVTVCELRKRFPQHTIYLLSPLDLQRSAEEREQFLFSFIGWYPVLFARLQSHPFLRFACKLKNRQEMETCEQLYHNCDLMVDISGYALGSNWGKEYINQYLDHIEFARAFRIPIYFMPQSYGPFDFEGEHAEEIISRCKELLPYAKVIFAREPSAEVVLKQRFGLSNVQLAPDIVLNNTGIDTDALFKSPPTLHTPKICSNSIGIVPNIKTTEKTNKEWIMRLYRAMIQHMLDQGKHIYILRHAESDRSLCEEIKSMFSDNKSIIMLDREFNCLEFSAIVEQFSILIASRFHAIVHAFKKGVPCLTIGWSEKYRYLLSQFEQEKFCFDAFDDVNIDAIINALEQLMANSAQESQVILRHLKDIQKVNVFDLAFSNRSNYENC